MQSTDVITLSVPPALTAVYLVPTAGPLADLPDMALQLARSLAAPFNELTTNMIDRGTLTVSQGPAGELPPLPVRELGLFGAEPADLARIMSATHLITIEAVYASGWPPYGDWAARGIAAGLAARLQSSIIDMDTPRIIDPDAASASLPDEHGSIRLSRWILVPYSTGENGCWFTTRGLGRFGLPELQTVGVPQSLQGVWADVLFGIADRLLAAWSTALHDDRRKTSAQIPAEFTVSAADIAGAYGAQAPAEPGRARVRLRLDPPEDPDGGPFLTVVPTDDFGRSAGEFYAATCAALLGEAPPDIRRSARTQRLADAEAIGSASLPAIRERFLAGSLPLDAYLLVRHRLTVDGRNENVWAAVDSWTDPQLIVGTCTNNAELDPEIRVGRPIRVDVSTATDWVLMRDGAGIIEGGWTIQALS